MLGDRYPLPGWIAVPLLLIVGAVPDALRLRAVGLPVEALAEIPPRAYVVNLVLVGVIALLLMPVLGLPIVAVRRAARRERGNGRLQILFEKSGRAALWIYAYTLAVMALFAFGMLALSPALLLTPCFGRIGLVVLVCAVCLWMWKRNATWIRAISILTGVLGLAMIVAIVVDSAGLFVYSMTFWLLVGAAPLTPTLHRPLLDPPKAVNKIEDHYWVGAVLTVFGFGLLFVELPWSLVPLWLAAILVMLITRPDALISSRRGAIAMTSALAMLTGLVVLTGFRLWSPLELPVVRSSSGGSTPMVKLFRDGSAIGGLRCRPYRRPAPVTRQLGAGELSVEIATQRIAAARMSVASAFVGLPVVIRLDRDDSLEFADEAPASCLP